MADNHDAAKTPEHSGRWAILGLLIVSVGMALFALWFRMQAGQRCLDFWGTDHAHRIQFAEQVELLRLAAHRAGESAEADHRDDEGAERFEVDGTQLRVTSRVNVTKRSGMTHVRGALVEDRGFDWTRLPKGPNAWTLLLRFEDAAGSRTEVLFDLDAGVLRRVDDPRILAFAPMEKFLRRFLGSEE